MNWLNIMGWVWIPLSIGAAAAQTIRNFAQRAVTKQAGTLGATMVRFLFGLPFALAFVLALYLFTSLPMPVFSLRYFGWIVIGALTQIAATALMLAAMKEKNFVVSIVLSRTDIIQVALLSAVLLGELPTVVSMIAIAGATVGTLMLSAPRSGSLGLEASGNSIRAILYGLGSGAAFALSSTGFRGAALQMPGTSVWMIGAWGVLWAQVLQSVVMGLWLAARNRDALKAVGAAWRTSLLAGCTGTLASVGWLTCFALRPAADVRTLGLVEVLFSYLVSRRMLRERLSPREAAGLILIAVSLVLICLQL